MLKTFMVVGAFLTGLATFSPAQAGPYADDLSQCLVKSASPSDQKDLVRWIFAAIALHPDIRSMANITPEQRVDIDKKAGALMMRLLVTDCRSETVAAIKYEGDSSLQGSFSVLGQIAAKGIFSAPEVNAGMAGLAANLNGEKLAELYKEAGAKLN